MKKIGPFSGWARDLGRALAFLLRKHRRAMTAVVVSTATAGAHDVKPLDSDAAPRSRETARFHHVHLNVTDPRRTIDFYKKFFGASEVVYRGKSDALLTEKSFILMHTVSNAPASNEGTSLWHIGWGGVDGDAEFGWRVAEGIRVQTPLTRPVLPGIDPKAAYMYFWGPDEELVEVSTASRNHRFDHVHLLASDAKATTAWFTQHLGLAAAFAEPVDFHGVMMNIVRSDNISIVIFSRPTPDRDNPFAAKAQWPAGGFQSTDGRAVDHLAFSYRVLGPVLARLQQAGVPIVRDIQQDPQLGHTSFFVRGPDQLLVEIVADKPLPEGIWDH